MSRRARVAGAVLLAAAALPAATLLGGPVERRDPPLVTVELLGRAGDAEAATGFAVAPGRVVTVAHVIDPARRLQVRRPDGRRVRARLLRVARGADLALLAVAGVQAPRLRIARGSPRAARLLLRRAGGRTTEQRAVVRRRVTARVRGPQAGAFTVAALELEASLAKGDSGAPVVDGGGALAGVVFAGSSRRAQTAYAIAARELEALLRRSGS